MVDEDEPKIAKSKELAGKILDERKKVGDIITAQLVGFEPFLTKIKTI